jgi:hypothetical protein
VEGWQELSEGGGCQQVDLKFGEGGQDVEEHLAHRIGRVEEHGISAS